MNPGHRLAASFRTVARARSMSIAKMLFKCWHTRPQVRLLAGLSVARVNAQVLCVSALRNMTTALCGSEHVTGTLV